MPDEKDHIEAREENAPEPPEPAPRGNRFSEPDAMPDHDMPPPLPT